MRAHYDFSKMKACRNPYVKLLKRPVTIRLDQDTVAYFKAMAVKTRRLPSVLCGGGPRDGSSGV